MGQNGLVNSHIPTKQHCTNYQNHKHDEESGPAKTGSYNYDFAL